MKPETAAAGFLLGVGAIVAVRRRAAVDGPAAPRAPELRHDPPPTFAFLYRNPNELAIRMRIGRGTFDTAKDNGIFQTEKKATDVAAANGWRLAWQGVRDL